MKAAKWISYRKYTPEEGANAEVKAIFNASPKSVYTCLVCKQATVEPCVYVLLGFTLRTLHMTCDPDAPALLLKEFKEVIR